MTTFKEPTTILEEHRPTLSPREQDELWHSIKTSITPDVISPYQRFLRPRVLASVALIVVVVSTSSTVAASESARPGDVLFPVEQVVEHAQLFVATPEVAAKLRTRYLEERWQELESLLEEDGGVDSEVSPQVELAVRTLLDHADNVEDDNRKEVVTRLLEQFDDEGIRDTDERMNTYRVRYKEGRREIRDDEDSQIRVDEGRVEFKDDDYRLRVDDDEEVEYKVDDAPDSDDQRSDDVAGDERRNAGSEDDEGSGRSSSDDADNGGSDAQEGDEEEAGEEGKDDSRSGNSRDDSDRDLDQDDEPEEDVADED